MGVERMVLTIGPAVSRRREAGDVRRCPDGRLLVCRQERVRRSYGGAERGMGLVANGRPCLEWVLYSERDNLDAPTVRLPRGTRLVRAGWLGGHDPVELQMGASCGP